MSVWTHVNGAVRLDLLRMVDKTPEEWQEVGQQLSGLFMGRTQTYDEVGLFGDLENGDYGKGHGEGDPCPCGSEGSLNYRFVTTGHESSLNFGSVLIWGDLRDYDNLTEIKDWFQKILIKIKEIREKEGIMLMVRDAVLHAYVESGDPVVLVSDRDEDTNYIVKEFDELPF